jgi:hypothetical protein
MTTSDTHAKMMPTMLCSGACLRTRSEIDSYVMYVASARKQTPTILSATLSFLSRRSTSKSTDILQSNAAPDVTSIKLSIPNPTREMLPAIPPARIATSPSRLFHAIVKYSSRLARPTILSRSVVCSMTRKNRKFCQRVETLSAGFAAWCTKTSGAMAGKAGTSHLKSAVAAPAPSPANPQLSLHWESGMRILSSAWEAVTWEQAQWLLPSHTRSQL